MKVDLLLVRYKIHCEIKATLCIPDTAKAALGNLGWTSVSTGNRYNVTGRCHLSHRHFLLLRTPAKEWAAATRSRI